MKSAKGKKMNKEVYLAIIHGDDKQLLKKSACMLDCFDKYLVKFFPDKMIDEDGLANCDVNVGWMADTFKEAAEELGFFDKQ